MRAINLARSFEPLLRLGQPRLELGDPVLLRIALQLARALRRADERVQFISLGLKPSLESRDVRLCPLLLKDETILGQE